MGHFGLATFTANQRTREIGICKILGATAPDLVSLRSREFILLVGLATLIAAPVAGWAMHQWLQQRRLIPSKVSDQNKKRTPYIFLG